jgi:hypothetical protein
MDQKESVKHPTAYGEHVLVDISNDVGDAFKLENEGSILVGKVLTVGSDVEGINSGDKIAISSVDLRKSTGNVGYIHKDKVFGILPK